MFTQRPSEDDQSAETDESTGLFSRRGYMKATAAASVGAATLSRMDEFVGTAAAYMQRDPAPEEYEIGGGIEYDNDVTRFDATMDVVYDRSDLKDRLANAGSGDVIWVNNDATIDLTGEKGLNLPSGATLASGRGIDGQRGALLYVDDGMDGDELFECAYESDIRFTGLQFRGPHPYYFCPDGGEPYDEYVAEMATCIWNYSNDGGYTAEIDNCQLWGWSQRAIAAGANSYENSIHVHHCSIHHNAIEHLGYGINLNNGPNHLIEYNYFEMNRHHITGFGQLTNGYEARYNYVGDGQECIDHPFDMHCQNSNNLSYEHNAGVRSTSTTRSSQRR